jgi:predicted DNA-binding protein
VGIHKGTKLTDTPKDYELKFRMDENTKKKLNFLCEKLNKTKAQIIRDGIEKQYAEISQQ